jgi:hypothetical protein
LRISSSQIGSLVTQFARIGSIYIAQSHAFVHGEF